MKRHLACALLVCLAPCALAETTVYGVLGVVARYSTNLDNTGRGRTDLTGSNLGAGYLGFRGIEEIGGGLLARMELESGFFVDNGAQRNNGLFGRKATIGLDGALGRLDFGRVQLTGTAAETLVRADPLKGAGQGETVWPGVWTGARFNNAVRYRKEFGRVFAGALVSLGEVDGGPGAGRTIAFTAGYLAPDVVAMAAWQDSRDAAGLRNLAVNIGGTWLVNGITVHYALMRATRDKGFVIGAAAGQALFNTDLGTAGIKAPADVRATVGLLGVTAPLAGNWRVRSAVFYERSGDATLYSATEGGRRRTAYAVLSYHFSNRTEMLFSADFNHWDGGWRGFWGASAASLAAKSDGFDTRRTIAAGINHTF